MLVYHDMLGMLQHPHHAQFVPRFCKNYASVGEEVRWNTPVAVAGGGGGRGYGITAVPVGVN